MSKGTPPNWVRHAKGGKAVAATGVRPVSKLEAEVVKLCKHLADISYG